MSEGTPLVLQGRSWPGHPPYWNAEAQRVHDRPLMTEIVRFRTYGRDSEQEAREHIEKRAAARNCDVHWENPPHEEPH